MYPAHHVHRPTIAWLIIIILAALLVLAALTTPLHGLSFVAQVTSLAPIALWAVADARPTLDRWQR